MWSSISQNFRLFSAILAKVTIPLVLIKYAHVLIYISVGEGLMHFIFDGCLLQYFLLLLYYSSQTSFIVTVTKMYSSADTARETIHWKY